MRFGLKVNPGTWEAASRWARLAEQVGFDGLWTGDNLRNPRDPAIPVQTGRRSSRGGRRRRAGFELGHRFWAVANAHDAWVTVCYTPKPDERDVFDKVVSRLADWR